MTSKRYVYYAKVSAALIIAAIYFYHFHNGFSQSPADWSSFADYICGLLSPLLTLLNIIVFIDLTKSIEQNRLAIEKNKDKEEEYRHKKDIEHQRQMQIFQLRVEEIHRLDNILENTFSSNIQDYHANIPASLIMSLTYIGSFTRNKIDIFVKSNEEKDQLSKLFLELHHILNELALNMGDINYQIDKSSMTQYLDTKAKIFKELYALTLGNKKALFY